MQQSLLNCKHFYQYNYIHEAKYHLAENNYTVHHLCATATHLCIRNKIPKQYDRNVVRQLRGYDSVSLHCT